MFQSLNATGTPLTAFETFKPLVVNYVESSGSNFKESRSNTYLEVADKLLSSKSSASAKVKLTNDFLTLVALTCDGSRQPKQFSVQRRWLNSKYEGYSSSSQREEFIRRIGDIAQFWSSVVEFDPSKAVCIPGIERVAEADRKAAITCILYLQKANHKMANAVLARFYSRILRGKQTASEEFIAVCRLVAAFYTLWRSAIPNTGLDEVYRKLLRKCTWEGEDSALTVEFISNHFREALSDKKLGTKSEWLNKAKDFLRYDEAVVVCRFALFVISENTVPDSSNPGLMVEGTVGSTPHYLTPELWVSELKSIEHVAPQQNEYHSSWDQRLYQLEEHYQRVGNLTLLPMPINSLLSNRGWVEKFFYYQHLAEMNKAKLNQLESEAESYGVKLHSQTVKLLTEVRFRHHIVPIVELGRDGNWDKDLVDRRSERICSILWDRLHQWLG